MKKTIATIEKVFIGKRTRDLIVIIRYGRDDYCAYWRKGECSERGSLLEILNMIKEDI